MLRPKHRTASLRIGGTLLCLLGAGAASCSRAEKTSPVLDEGKVGSVLVGHSSRADVFAALGRPTRTERSAGGEAWVYDVKEAKSGRDSVLGSAAAGSAILGTFIPYAGLLGSGIGLANAAGAGAEPPPDKASLTVAFGPDGIVHDCIYATTAAPAIDTASGQSPARPVDCGRPPAPVVRR